MTNTTYRQTGRMPQRSTAKSPPLVDRRAVRAAIITDDFDKAPKADTTPERKEAQPQA